MRYCVLKYATATPIYVMPGVKALIVLADSYIIANNNGSLSSAVYLQKFSFLTHRRRYCRAPNVKRQCCPSVCMSRTWRVLNRAWRSNSLPTEREITDEI